MSESEGRVGEYSRRRPVIELDGGDFGLDSIRLVFKLEFLQHTGSFKARGAITNLLLRDAPPAGVVAASGGNHGVAVGRGGRAPGNGEALFVRAVGASATT